MSTSFFFSHLIPEMVYQSVVSRFTDQADQIADLHLLLFLNVCHVLLSELPASAHHDFVKLVVLKDDQLMDWLVRTLPNARQLIQQTLDRTLLAAASAVH